MCRYLFRHHSSTYETLIRWCAINNRSFCDHKSSNDFQFFLTSTRWEREDSMHTNSLSGDDWRTKEGNVRQFRFATSQSKKKEEPKTTIIEIQSGWQTPISINLIAVPFFSSSQAKNRRSAHHGLHPEIRNEPKWAQFFPIALLYCHAIHSVQADGRKQKISKDARDGRQKIIRPMSIASRCYFVNQMGSFIEKSGLLPFGGR